MMMLKNRVFLKCIGCCVIFLLFSCSASVELKWLEGYWQIEKVTQENETFVPALGNVQYDYYTLTNPEKGFRKKLSPSFGSTLTTSRDQTNFELIKEGDSWVLSFETAWDKWQEKLIVLDSLQLILEHNNKRYFYKHQYPTDE